MHTLDLARLRAAVALLGAEGGAGWWRGRSLDRTGRAVLARLFPTAPTLAAVGAAVAAASRAHDERIGRSGVYHAFRLPLSAEAAIEGALADGGEGVLATAVRDADAARETLRALAADAPPVDPGSEGPLAIGTADWLTGPDAPATLAALYLAALDAGRPVYPYVTLAG